MNKQTEYDRKCGIAIDFIPNEKFKKEIIENNSLENLSKECREFVELCYEKQKEFKQDLENFEFPKELEKYKSKEP